MMRDPGPIHNLGFSVTSRDIPTNEGDSEGVAPNSGYVSRALNGHPIMKFFAVSALSMAGAMLASKSIKKGGLRLGKFIQEKADSGESHFATSIVKNVTDIRRHLDELQGVDRYIEGERDAYSKIVFEQSGKTDTQDLVTGYSGALSERRGYGFLTYEEKKAAARNFMSEPAAVWAFRDELQQRLIRTGRRLPYELPALYGTQKLVVDPLFGERDNSERKVKWYNPFDVIADFTTSSLTNLATMVIPFELAGAGASQARSSLHTLRYSLNDMRRLTPNQKRVKRGFKEVSELLTEVGHDFATLTNKFLKTSAQVSGSLSSAADIYRNQSDFVQNLFSLRHGVKAANEANIAKTGASGYQLKPTFDAIFKGFKSDAGDKYKSIFELSPSFRGVIPAFKAGFDDYKILGKGYDALESSLAYTQVLNSLAGTPKSKADLENAMYRIQSQHSSRLSSFAEGVRALGGGGPGSDKFTRSQFYIGSQQKAFKELLEQQLISRGVGIEDAAKFVEHAKILGKVRPTSNITNILSIGKNKITSGEVATEDIINDHLGQIMTRYKRIRGSGGFLGVPNINNVLRESIESSRDYFTSREFQKNLKNKLQKDWNTLYRRDLYSLGEGVIKSRKAQFQDFIQPNTYAKQDFLMRKTAQSLGIKLVDSDGLAISDAQVTKALSARGFGSPSDSHYFTDLRAFLIKNRKMTSGVIGGGFNLFGLQALTIEEGLERGRLSHLSDENKKIITDLAGRRAREDPVASALTRSTLDGVYKTKTGEVLDFTAIKSTFSGMANFFASEFKIPILGFNPVDLFGYRSFAEMANKSPLQYVSSKTVQPFLPTGESRADFYIWAKGRGISSKGRLIRFDSNDSDSVYGTVMDGMYRAFPTASADLLTRHARYGSGGEGATVEEALGGTKSRYSILNFLFGDNAVKAQRKLSLDSEQPNSLIGAITRFRRRKEDINNFSVLANRLKEFDPSKIKDSDLTPDLLRSIDEFRKAAMKYGSPVPLMRELESKFPEFFQLLGLRASEITSPKVALDFFDQIEEAIPQLTRRFSQAGIDPKFLQTSVSRIRILIDEGNLAAVSQLAERSPTITTRLDQLQQEVFRFFAQTNQALTNQTGNDIFINIINATDELVSKGVISGAQRVEAQASALGTMFNFSAFRTFSDAPTATENQKAAVAAFLNTKTGAERLLDPYTEGTISQISSSIRKRFSPLLAPMKKRFGSAPYSPSDIDTDPLGSGQSVTLVPTFGTVFGRDPFAAIASALGINTYKNPQGFSTGSIAVSQGVERLNRYFGSIGMQLDVSDFSGPLDLFARGMVGKRVLPMYAAGVTALTIDRTLGGMVNPEDAYGENVYSPLVLGAVGRVAAEGQAALSGLYPGGMTYQEKREQLVEDGEVPIRQGRYWPLGNTPFKGGKIMYYRPSWYRKLQGGAMFTSDTYGSPLEKFLFNNDISPLRPFDPYRFEREHYNDRPYPVTGEYFTGPFGPLVPIANATIGKILKPQLTMHEEELMAGLSSYVPGGQFGAYNSRAYSGVATTPGPFMGSGGGSASGMGFGFGSPSSGAVISGIGSINSEMASRSGSTFTGGNIVRQDIGNINSNYIQSSFGPPKISGVMNPRIVPSGEPLRMGGSQFQLSELGYRTQEMLGIYGFGFGSLRQSLGFGQSDFEPQRAVLQSAAKAYGSTRAFWDLNLGGLGDVPLPAAEGIGNIEFSEIVRRFIPKERTGVDYINPIPNTMGQQYNWLPGPEYYTDFTTGDPFTKVQEGEIRLPGVGYERFNRIFSDNTGRYGLINQLDILGDIAPYSTQYKKINSLLNKTDLSPEERVKLKEIRDQVEDTSKKFEFSEYKYRDNTPVDLGISRRSHTLGRINEYIAHSDTFVTNKIFGKRTALEDWERNNVYGTTFPEWQRPFESYIKPMAYKATQDNPIIAASSLGLVGGMFGRTPRGRLLGSAVGISTGATASIFGNVKEFITDDRFIPTERKKELALEEYSDILSYVKNVRLAKQAQAQGDIQEAAKFKSAAGRTMYGMDLTRLEGPGKRLDQISLALPKRKREHFVAMVDAPERDREKILSTAGRLERRLYQAAWGMRVEKKPELAEYFSKHELPNENWEGWSPSVSMDSVKIKMGQSMGLQMSQMGYYPQQIKEANLLNPSYPQFGLRQNNNDITNRLRRLMFESGINGSVTPVMNPFGSQQLDVSAGIS